MSAVLESLDLDSWVKFGTGDGETCDGRGPSSCGNEAVVLVFWEQSCDCGPNPRRACIAHRDELLQIVAERQWQSNRFRCFWCDAPSWLLRMEPIR